MNQFLQIFDITLRIFYATLGVGFCDSLNYSSLTVVIQTIHCRTVKHDVFADGL